MTSLLLSLLNSSTFLINYWFVFRGLIDFKVMISIPMHPTLPKKEGMKSISSSVFSVLKDHKECTYQFICNILGVNNNETANRRIYDILNVLRAVNMVGKRKKIYYLIDNTDDIRRKRDEKKKLELIKESFQYITTRNNLMSDTQCERLYPPFMLVSTDKKSEIHCDTNEERSYFNFKSNKPLYVLDDLGVLREIKKQSEEDSKGIENNLFFDKFIF